MGAFVYDKSDYHMGQGADTWEKASGAALFVLRWMMERNFLDPAWWNDGAMDSLAKYRNGKMTLFALYERECDLSLTNDMFSEEGNAFGQLYFDYTNGRFLDDLESVLHYGKKNYPDFSEAAFSRIQPTVDARHDAWKKGDTECVNIPRKKSWMFWKR